MAPATKEAGTTLVVASAPAVIVTCVTDVSSSMGTSPLVWVSISKTPVPPVTDGFLTPVNVNAAPTCPAVIVAAVIVTTCPTTLSSASVPVILTPAAFTPAPVTSNPAGKVTATLPPLTAFTVVKVTRTSPVAPATKEADTTLVDASAPAVIVTAATAVSSSMGVLALSCVCIVKVPLLPLTAGLTMPESTMLPIAPPARVVPLVRVNVTTCPDTPIVPTPSRVPPTLTKAADATLKPAGNVIAILPLAATGLAVVKVAVTLGDAPATSDAGTTLVADSAPAVIV